MFNDYQDILTVDDLCEILSIGKNSAYVLLSTKQIKAFKYNRIWKIPKIAIMEYVVNSSGIKSSR